jgi:hypothetical protein
MDCFEGVDVLNAAGCFESEEKMKQCSPPEDNEIK